MHIWTGVVVTDLQASIRPCVEAPILPTFVTNTLELEVNGIIAIVAEYIEGVVIAFLNSVESKVGLVICLADIPKLMTRMLLSRVDAITEDLRMGLLSVYFVERFRLTILALYPCNTDKKLKFWKCNVDMLQEVWTSGRVLMRQQGWTRLNKAEQG
jgi:hypothetical protein